MQKILKMIQDLYDQLVLRIKQVDDDSGRVARDRLALDKEIADLKVLHDDLLKREAKVKKVEDVVVLTQQAQATLEVAADKEAKLHKAQADFDKACKVREKALKEAEFQRDLRSKKLDQREAAVADREKNYKQQILANLGELKKKIIEDYISSGGKT